MGARNNEQQVSKEEQTLFWRFNRFLERHLPEGIYSRSLIIIVAPMVLLQSVVAFTFMERHWQTVTKRLSEAVSQDIAMLIDVYEIYPQYNNYERLIKMSNDRLELSLTITPNGELPPAKPKPFFSLLDKTLSKYLARELERPFWIDTVGRSDFVDIRVKLKDGTIFQIIARRSRTYASNSEISLNSSSRNKTGGIFIVGSPMIILRSRVFQILEQIRLCSTADKARYYCSGPNWQFGKGQANQDCSRNCDANDRLAHDGSKVLEQPALYKKSDGIR